MVASEDEGVHVNAATAPIPVLSQRPLWRDTFSSMKVHNYRLYVVAQLISNTSTWVQRIAVDWLIFQLTGSVAAVGFVAAMQFGPALLFGPLGGVITDRFPRRQLVMVTQAVTGSLCAVLAALTLSGMVQSWQVFVIAFLLGCVAVVDQPARRVLVHEMVGQARLGNAISVNASIFHLGGLGGPALSGLLITLFGAGWSIGVTAVAACFVIGTLLLLRKSELMPSPPIKPKSARRSAMSGRSRQSFGRWWQWPSFPLSR